MEDSALTKLHLMDPSVECCVKYSVKIELMCEKDMCE